MRSGWSVFSALSPAGWRACQEGSRCSLAPARTRPIFWSLRPPIAALPAASTPILREARRRIRELEAGGKSVVILIIGRRGRDGLRRDYGRLIRDSLTEVGRRRLSFDEARDIAERILVLFQAGGFDVCTIFYNRFRSAMTQIVTVQQLIPFAPEAPDRTELELEAGARAGAVYEFEPSEEEILTELLPKNLAVQIFMALLENAAREQVHG